MPQKRAYPSPPTPKVTQNIQELLTMPKSNAGGPGRGSMGALGAPPGHVLGTLGALLGTLGALLGALGDALGRSWDALGHLLNASCKKVWVR